MDEAARSANEPDVITCRRVRGIVLTDNPLPIVGLIFLLLAVAIARASALSASFMLAASLIAFGAAAYMQMTGPTMISLSRSTGLLTLENCWFHRGSRLPRRQRFVRITSAEVISARLGSKKYRKM